MKKIAVLGSGMVGSAMAMDLSIDFQVTIADIDNRNLGKIPTTYPIKKIQADCTNPGKLKEIISDVDLVIGAMPGFLGYESVRNVIALKKNIVDISFFPEDTFGLDEEAKRNGVIAITDCGVAPGMGNILLGYHNKRMQIESFECYVGGLPFERHFPFEYKAPFSPIDVIEEYTREARFVVNGRIVIKPALTDPELIEFPGIGTLEAFNSDGLRSLIKTINAPNMIEKTLRYPGHIRLIQALKAAGFFSQEAIDIQGHKIKPIDFTSALLFEQWKLQPDENEFTVMKIVISGTEAGTEGKYIYYLLDFYDEKTGISSMARTTGYTATAVANLVLSGKYTRVGISPPDYIGEDEFCYNFVLNYLKDRGVVYRLEK
ncbi:MAG: saccharopine dehydrogenase [Ignavibacteria bacterium]|nr:saccharopine dehydrogenase [Ignavibacteria bacterium]